MAVETRRACGFRKVGGLYLVSDGLAEPCHRLPHLLTVCPTCGAGITPARGWTWVDPRPLFAPDCFTPGGPHGDCDHCPRCPVCRVALFGSERAGLLWVGERFYPRPTDFAAEAITLGVSRRVAAVPRGFKLGATWVLLAHRKAHADVVPDCPAPDELDVGPVTRWHAGIVYLFRPTRVEKIVTESQAADPAVRQEAECKGWSLVPVPDGDPDHQGSVYDEPEPAEPAPCPTAN